jgi:flagellar hook-associated protein 2
LSTNSGIGFVPAYTTGADVAGTINGETAIGHGQTLTGVAGNKNTAGLILTVTASSPGQYGSVNITQGIGTQMFGILSSILDPTNGEIASAETGLNSQITDNEKQIEKVQTEVASQTTYLQQLFSDMETRVSQLNSQGQAFAAQAQGLMSWSSNGK